MLKRRIAFLPLMVLAAAGTAVTQGLAVGAAEPSDADIAVQSEEEVAATNRMGNAIRRDIKDREARQAARDQALTLRERTIAAAEKRLSEQLSEESQAAPRAPAEPQVNQFDSLARIYQTMKPKRAAAVFEQLALHVQVEVATRMKERSIALIIANMSPDRAAMLTMALADPGSMPASAKAEEPETPAAG